MFETPVYPQQVTFARGEVSPYLFGRVDLVAYVAGLRTLRNMFVRPEGAVSNRSGYTYVGSSLTATSKGSIEIPFTFSATQSYVLEVGAGSAQVFSNGSAVLTSSPKTITNVVDGTPVGQRTITTSAAHGLSVGQTVVISGIVATGTALANGFWVVQGLSGPNAFFIQGSTTPSGVYTSGGTVTAVASFATPWAAQDLLGLRWSQSTDTLTVVHPKYPTYEIKRTSANTFTCLPAAFFGGPFLQQNNDGVTFVFASAGSGTVTLTASAPIFNANHVGALFQLTQQDLSQIPPWEPVKPIVLGGPTYCRSSLKNYLATSAVVAGANPATGTIFPNHSQGTQQDGNGQPAFVGTTQVQAGINWQYQDSGFGIVLITAFTDSTHVTGVVQPNYVGGPGLLPISVVGGNVTAAGPFTFSGNGSTQTFTPLTGITSNDPNKFVVTVNGTYQAPSTYSINLGATSITFNTAPPSGTNNVIVKQISGFGQTSFWAFGAFSADQGYASAVTYFPDRLVLAATQKQPVGVFGSRTSDYHNFNVSNPVVASDAFTIFLNARQLNAISDLIPLSDLLVGTSNIIWRLWPGSTGIALSPLAIAANPQSYYGESPNVAGCLYGDSAIFAEYDGRRLRDLIYQFAYDKFMGQELTLYSRHLIPFGTQFQRIVYKPDAAAQFVFGLRSDGVLLCCTYLREQQIIGWARWDTSGTFEDICVVPETTRFGLYAITNRTIAGLQQRLIERLADREWSTIYDYRFLDCNFTYDGRNTGAAQFRLLGGTTWLAGDNVSLSATSGSGWATFVASDATNANQIWLYDPAGVRVRVKLTSITSSTTAAGVLMDPAPFDLQGGQLTAVWTFARTFITGATPLANAAVVALADSTVYGIGAADFAPNGALVVDPSGAITLPFAAGVLNVGLPYLSDFETLPLNMQGQETIRMRAKTNPVIFIDVQETRNFLAGTDFTTQNMRPSIERAFETYTAPTNVQSGILWTRVPSTLDSECHTCIRQNHPLPITIRMHIPQVTIGEPVS